MAEEKKYPLAIVLKADDQASAKLRKLDADIQGFAKGVGRVGAGFKKLGTEAVAGLRETAAKVKELSLKFLEMGAVVGLGVHEMDELIEKRDQLAKTADRLGLTVDALAQLQFAAGQSGVEDFGDSLEKLSKGFGLLKANSGPLYGLLKKVSPELLKQLKGAKGTEEAFDVMAAAMVKVQDPAKRAALATAAFGRSGAPLINLLAKGPKGIEELKQEYFKLAGPQEEAARKSEEMHDALGKVHASMDGIKSAILVGLAPAFLDLSGRLSDFISAHRADVERWATEFGKKLPGAVAELVKILGELVDVAKAVAHGVGWLVDQVGGAENAVKLLVGAFVALKAIKITMFLSEVAGEMLGLEKAAVKATAATKALEAASGAGGAAGGAEAAAAGGGRKLLAGAIPLLGATYAAAKASAIAVDHDQELRMSAKDRGGILLGDLERFRSKGSTSSLQMLQDSLRQGGFIDPKTGRFRDTAENRNAIVGGGLFDGAYGVDVGKLKKSDELIREFERDFAKKQLAANAPPTKITVDFQNAPKGTKVETKPGGDAKVDTSVGYQMAVP